MLSGVMPQIVHYRPIIRALALESNQQRLTVSAWPHVHRHNADY